jgi:tetratricopeptide (TPR) repeat protein
METGISADLDLMRASALLESDPQAAARLAGAILEAFPGHEEARLLLATASQRSGDGATARAQLESLLGAQPDSPTLQLELARAHAAAGRHAEAIGALQAALKLDARFADGWRELAAQRFITGDTSAGDAAYAEYARLATPPPELADANFAIANRRLDTAEAMLKQHLQHSPEDVMALRMYASVASKRGDSFEAERLLKQCLQLAPGYADARFDLASELYAQHRHTEVMPLIERLLATYPGDAGYMALKAQVLRLHGRNAEATALMRQAIAASPGNAKLRLLHGHLLREVGQQAEAIETYRQALALQPGMGEAYWSLANLKTVHFTEADLQAMQRQLAGTAPLDANRVSLEFALGKALEDAGQYAQSFEHYAYGNRLHRTLVFHNPRAVHDVVERSKSLFLPPFFSARAGWGSERADPIFIVGMPRSGSTLLEQILASHSQVEGTRELPEVPAIVRELIIGASDEDARNYPGLLSALGRSDIEAYAVRFLERTAGHRALGRPRFVDKLPGNFLHVGLIHLMFPQATIIDSRRHPLGCCFSCFKQLFARDMHFTYDQEELGRYYRDYVELMEHMDTVLPGRVHRVYYEQLVSDPEGVVRRLLEHCGLPFEEDCLRFYENPRVVNTISSEQVRRPISPDAVDHWRHYEPWLGELKKALGDLVDRYPGFPAQPA